MASSVLVVCILIACSVWAVHGRRFQVSIDDIDDQEPGEVEVSVDAEKNSGMCWVCKWSLNKVKKAVGSNATVEKLTSKLKSVCDHIRHLKYVCRKFVKKHMAQLVKELSTSSDVRTICVRTGACASKEMSNLLYPHEEEPSIELQEYLWRYMDDE